MIWKAENHNFSNRSLLLMWLAGIKSYCDADLAIFVKCINLDKNLD